MTHVSSRDSKDRCQSGRQAAGSGPAQQDDRVGLAAQPLTPTWSPGGSSTRSSHRTMRRNAARSGRNDEAHHWSSVRNRCDRGELSHEGRSGSGPLSPLFRAAPGGRRLDNDAGYDRNATSGPETAGTWSPMRPAQHRPVQARRQAGTVRVKRCAFIAFLCFHPASRSSFPYEPQDAGSASDFHARLTPLAPRFPVALQWNAS